MSLERVTAEEVSAPWWMGVIDVEEPEPAPAFFGEDDGTEEDEDLTATPAPPKGSSLVSFATFFLTQSSNSENGFSNSFSELRSRISE